jgi:hypothetical protein
MALQAALSPRCRWLRRAVATDRGEGGTPPSITGLQTSSCHPANPILRRKSSRGQRTGLR